MGYKVSVIITTYNREYSIVRRAIKSVLNQTYSDYELIVVNDTPSEFPTFDEVTNGITEFKGKLKYIANGINHGACFVRNQGFKESMGEYIAFLDDDDEWLHNKLQEQVQLILSKNCVMVTCGFNCIWLDSNNKQIKQKIKNNRRYEITLQEVLFKNIVGGCSAPLISRKAFIKCGGFNIDMPAAQDADLWIRLAKIGNIYCVLKPLLNYYIYKAERISNNPAKKIYAIKYLIEQYKDLVDKQALFLKDKYIIIAYYYYVLENKEDGYRYYKLAKRQNVISKTSVFYYFKIIKLKIKNI